MNDDRRRNAPGKGLSGLTDFLLMGIMMGACIAVGLLLGLGLDKWLGISPWGVLLGIAWGIAAAVYHTAKVIIADGRRLRESRDARESQFRDGPHP